MQITQVIAAAILAFSSSAAAAPYTRSEPPPFTPSLTQQLFLADT